jgi:3-deoxy-D-manno-octulosonic-acid transferase
MSWKGRVALQLYSVLTRFLQPFVRRKLLRRGQLEAGYLHAIEQRFGHHDRAAASGYVWVHAVSLGETRAAAVLLKALRAEWPGLPVLLTHGTATGREQGQQLLQAGDCQAWLPWDTPEAVDRFLKHFQPRVGLLMETEVWPNLVAGCRANGVPLILANARMSEKSMQQARRWAWLARPAYAGLADVWAQTEADALRLRSLGATVSHCLGNLKFDATPDPVQRHAGVEFRKRCQRPVVMLASSREGEEAQLLQGLLRSPEAMNTVQWLIVPRHPQRFDTVAQLIESMGLAVLRRTQWGDPDHGLASAQTPALWLGDSVGEMAWYYSLSAAALLGGSFEKLGGQNLIEAAACACPVLMGPHTFNFAEAADMALQAQAAVRMEGMAQAMARAQALVSDQGELTRRSAAALGFASQHRGAAQRSVSALKAFLK